MFEIRQHMGPVLLWLTTQYPAMKEDGAADKVVLDYDHFEMDWWFSVPTGCKLSEQTGIAKPGYILVKYNTLYTSV